LQGHALQAWTLIVVKTAFLCAIEIVMANWSVIAMHHAQALSPTASAGGLSVPMIGVVIT
jgi:hypothetical protein